MKKLILKRSNLTAAEVLTRAQLKKVQGGDGGSGEGTGRCSNDRICGAFGGYNGGCATMQTGQCRCVKYQNGGPVASVPDSYCVA